MFGTIFTITGVLFGVGIIRGVTKPLIRYFTPKVKGHVGERKAHRKLRRFARRRKDGVCMRDILLPTRNKTTQIDNILINRYGIFIIEVKNYSGKVFGNEKDRMWTHETGYKKKQTHEFLNPLIQNKGHIDALRDLLKNHPNLRCHSIVAFSNDCELHGIMPDVCHFRDLSHALKMRCQGEPCFTAAEVQAIAAELQSLNIPGKEARKEHALRTAAATRASKKVKKDEIDSLYEEARNAPLLTLDTPAAPKQEVPKQHSLLSDEGAMVRIKGRTDSIQHFFERSKRDAQGLPVPDKAAFTHFVCPYTGKSFPVSEAKSFYRGLWVTYLKQNPELVTHLQELGPERIHCPSLRTETVLRSYVQDSAAFQSEIRQSAWYQNMAQQQKSKHASPQHQALDKIIEKHPLEKQPIEEHKSSLDNQIRKADDSRQPPQSNKYLTNPTLTH